MGTEHDMGKREVVELLGCQISNCSPTQERVFDLITVLDNVDAVKLVCGRKLKQFPSLLSQDSETKRSLCGEKLSQAPSLEPREGHLRTHPAVRLWRRQGTVLPLKEGSSNAIPGSEKD